MNDENKSEGNRSAMSGLAGKARKDFAQAGEEFREFLTPCHCGKPPKVEEVRFGATAKGWCVKCQACNRRTAARTTREEAVKAWNEANR